MKKQILPKTQHIVPILLPLVLGGGSSLEAAILLFEDFETWGLGTRYFATNDFSDGADDYFTRTDGFSEASGIPQYYDFSGKYFWAAEDIDSTDNPDALAILDFPGIDLAGFNQISISLDIGAGSTVTFDSVDDFLFVQYRVDSGPWNTALAFQNDGQTYNSGLHQDTDFDGIGDGPMLGFGLVTVTSDPFAVTGGSLDLRIDTLLTGNGEAVAFDNIQVVGVPEPATTALILGTGAAAFLAVRRKRFPPRRGNESRA